MKYFKSQNLPVVPGYPELQQHEGIIQLTLRRRWRHALALGQAEEEDDYYQEAVLAAMRAVDTYDPTRGAKLSTCIGYRVDWALRNYTAKQTLIKMPQDWSKHSQHGPPYLLRTIIEWDTQWLVEQSPELAQDHVKVEPLLTEDRIRDPFLPKFLARLKESQRKVLLLWAHECSLQQIGYLEGYTRERARQVREAALAKLRKQMQIKVTA